MLPKISGLDILRNIKDTKDIPREELFERIWGFDALGDNSTITVHVARVREKIESAPSNPQHIETVWGVGYRLRV